MYYKQLVISVRGHWEKNPMGLKLGSWEAVAQHLPYHSIGYEPCCLTLDLTQMDFFMFGAMLKHCVHWE